MSLNLDAYVRHEKANFSVNGILEEMDIEIRTDPLDGHTTRIVPPRGLDRPLVKSYKEHLDKYIKDLISMSDFCPFCNENVMTITATMPHEFGQGRFIRGNSVLFPNIHPYGGYSPVNVINIEKHFMAIDEFSPKDLGNSLKNFQDWSMRVRELDGNVRYLFIGMNYLPPSGSSIVHPHMQAFTSYSPEGIFGAMLQGFSRYREKYGHDFWIDFFEHSEFIAYQGMDWYVFTPFAPIGLNEVDILHGGTTPFMDIDEDSIDELADLITKILKFYGTKTWNSFNLGIYTSFYNENWSTLVRIVMRMPVYPYYRNDETYIEKMFHVFVVDRRPEDLAKEVRTFLTEQETNADTPSPA